MLKKILPWILSLLAFSVFILLFIQYQSARVTTSERLSPLATPSTRPSVGQSAPRRDTREAFPTVASKTPDAEAGIRERGKLLNRLPTGKIVFDAPPTMKVGDKRQVEAIAGIGVSIEKLRSLVRAESQKIEGALKLSDEMAATLSGPGFKIVATAPEQQSVAKGYPTVWSWDIEAIEAGDDQQLTATLYALIPGGPDKTARQRVDSYVQKIMVSVRPLTWSERLESFSKEFDAVKAIIVTLFGVATVVGGWLGISLVRRKSSGEAPSGD